MRSFTAPSAPRARAIAINTHSLFTFSWPVWVLAVLLFVAMVLLFFVSMTSVFLLRVFFADRRGGRGRQSGVARPQTRVISTEEDQTDE